MNCCLFKMHFIYVGVGFGKRTSCSWVYDDDGPAAMDPMDFLVSKAVYFPLRFGDNLELFS